MNGEFRTEVSPLVLSDQWNLILQGGSVGSLFRPAIKRSGKPLAPRNASIQPSSEGTLDRRAGLISESNC